MARLDDRISKHLHDGNFSIDDLVDFNSRQARETALAIRNKQLERALSFRNKQLEAAKPAVSLRRR